LAIRSNPGYSIPQLAMMVKEIEGTIEGEILAEEWMSF